MYCTAHQVTLAAPVRLTARVAPGVLPLLVGHLGDRVPGVDPGVVDQHVQAAEVRMSLVDHLPDGVGVGQVGLDDRMAAARQPGQDLAGQLSRPAMVHRHPVS
jgi:hypothetical protein